MSRLDDFCKELIWFVQPVVEAVEDEESLKSFFSEFGYDLTGSDTEIGNAVTEIRDTLYPILQGLGTALADGSLDLSVPQELLTTIRSTGESQSIQSLIADASEFPGELFSHLFYHYISTKIGILSALLEAFGVITITRVTTADAGGRDLDYDKVELHWDRLGVFVTDSGKWAKEVYGWGATLDTDGRIFDYEKAIASLAHLIESTQLVLSRKQNLTPTEADFFLANRGGITVNEVVIPFFQDEFESVDDAGDPEFRNEIGLKVLPSGDLNQPANLGLAMAPFAKGTLPLEIALSDNLTMNLVSSASATGGVYLRLTPDGVEVMGGGVFGADFSFGFTYRNADNSPAVLVGGEGQTRLESSSIGTQSGVSIGSGSTPEVFAEFFIQGGALVIQGGDGDGFIQKILPQDPITVLFDLTLGVSNTKGFYVKGGAGLEYTFHVNQEIGPIFIGTIDLAIFLKDGNIELNTALSAGASLGPIKASVSKIGLKALLEPGKKGLLGFADLSLGFKPPTGIALGIDPPPVRGGGGIFIDPPNYTGILNLTIEETVDVTAIGLLTTEMPGGQPGFSLLISLSARFSPIQLSFGFALTGVGGLIGINRTMLEEPLRDAFKRHTLDYILFPEDPISDAALIIDAIQSVFPPREDRFVIGLMGEIIWGSATPLVVFNFGVIIELGGPGLVVLIGQGSTALPTKETPVVEINVDLLGFIDLGAETVAIDAELYDSRITVYPLSGEMALRSGWGSEADFIWSMGGFHPRFNPPPGFPRLDRLMISRDLGVVYMSLECYLAITTNTFQVGALLSIDGDFGVASAKGGTSFDTLIKFSPFSFDVDFKLWLDLKVAGAQVAELDVSLNLTGPNPFHAIGYAHFSMLFISVDVDVDITMGERIPAPPPEVSPFDKALEAFQDVRSLVFELPDWASSHVSLLGADPSLQLEGPAVTPKLLDPAGSAVVSQGTMPLALRLDRVGGGTPPANERYLELITALPSGSVTARFAPAQFRNMSDTEKLQAPPFERFESGLRITAAFERGASVHFTRAFEVFLVDKEHPGGLSQPGVPVPLGQLSPLMDDIRRSLSLQRGGLFKPSKAVADRDHPKYVSVGDVEFTVTTATADGGVFARATVNGQAVQNMTYLQALDTLQSTGSVALVIQDAAFADPPPPPQAAPTLNPNQVPDGHLVFLSYYRRGLLANLVLDINAAQWHGDLIANLQSRSAPDAAAIGRDESFGLPVTLAGPGDVEGIVPSVISRLQPPPSSNDFEPNLLAFVEFRDPDFPWRYSMSPANGATALQPWLMLVVLSSQELSSIDERQGEAVIKQDASGHSYLKVAWDTDNQALFPSGLGNLSAHAQVEAPDVLADNDLDLYIQQFPDRHGSRLFSFRKLQPETAYTAFIVPHYLAGSNVISGAEKATGDLTRPIVAADGATVRNFPIYFQWSFQTSEAGDFEALVRRLEPIDAPEDTGRRPVDDSFNFDAGAIEQRYFHREGALAAPGFSQNRLVYETQLTQQERTSGIAADLNAGLAYLRDGSPSTDPSDPDPLVSLPYYGRYHQPPTPIVEPADGQWPAAATWGEELNLDLRNRVAAGLGTRVVQEHQEELARQCWEQVGDLRLANDKLQQAQGAMHLSDSLKTRHMSNLSDERFVLLTPTAHAHFPLTETGQSQSLRATLDASGLPLGAPRAVFKRIAGQRVGLDRIDLFAPWHIAQRCKRIHDEWWRRWLARTIRMLLPILLGIARVLAWWIPSSFTAQVYQWAKGAAQTLGTRYACGWPRVPNRLYNLEQRFKEAMREWGLTLPLLEEVLPLKPRVVPVRPIDIAQDFRPRFSPRKVVQAKLGLTIQFNDGRAIPESLDPIMDTPRIREPMYRHLSELSLDYVLPGLADLPNNSVTLLEENTRFVAGYLAGVNVELGREMAWRLFPCDQQGTFCPHFWESAQSGTDPDPDPESPRRDIPDLHEWDLLLGRNLVVEGGETGLLDGEQRVVLLIKGDLIRRYPDAIFYAVELHGATGQSPWCDGNAVPTAIAPLFRGQLGPDVLVVGFPFTTTALDDADTELYFVIQQNEVRDPYGLDVANPEAPLDPANYNWSQPTLSEKGYVTNWGDVPHVNPAVLAGSTAQRRVQLIVHSSNMMPPSPGS